MPKLRWPVVLFDLDGTLADSISLVVASYAYAFSTVNGRTIDPEQAKRWIGETLATTMAREDPSNTDRLQAAYRAYCDAHLDMIGGYPGVPGLLARLRASGATTGVVTSKGRDIAVATMARAGVAQAIELVCSRESTTVHKPDPAPLLEAASILGVAPQDCVYVGDAVHDIRAARAACMAAVAVTWGAGVRDELVALGPDAICDDADQLTRVLFSHES